MSRLIRAAYGDGREVHYVYDPVGNRKQMIEGVSGGPAPCAGDADCDGVADAADNCPSIAQPDQTDTDGTPPAPNLVAGWEFDEGSGTTAADVEGTSPGTVVGATWVTGQIDKALSFQGTSHVRLPQTPALNVTGQGLTLAAWVKPTVNGGGVVIHKDFQYSLRVGSGFVQYAQSVSWGYRGFAHNQIPTDTWTHVAVTYDGTNIRVYVNGILTDTLSQPGSLTGTNNRAHIGCYAGVDSCQSTHFQGSLDEVAVYNRRLSDSEIRAVMSIGLAPTDGMGDACDPCPNSRDPSCTPRTCQDPDGDGYGVPGASACSGGAAKFDCDNNDPARHPGAIEACDQIDNDCNGRVDDGCLANPQTTTYEYNDFNQLLSATGPAGATTFESDPNGNQTNRTAAGVTTEYVWDARDRLTQVLVGGTQVAGYGYDAHNLRTYVNDSRGERRILLDGIEELAEYEVASGNRRSRYDHDVSRVDAVLAQLEAGAKSYAYTDALGSVYGLVDGSGGVASRYSYDVYGARSAAVEGVPTSWGFTGRRQDTSGGMYYRERYYAAALGVFAQADPIPTGTEVADLVTVINKYAYVDGNPITRTDPSGLVWPPSSFVNLFGLTVETAQDVVANASLVRDLEDIYYHTRLLPLAPLNECGDRASKCLSVLPRVHFSFERLMHAARMTGASSPATVAAAADLGAKAGGYIPIFCTSIPARFYGVALTSVAAFFLL